MTGTSVNWGDIPTWVAAIGTSGTLATSMYIILKDRLTPYRSSVNELFFAFLPRRDALAGEDGLILTFRNPCSKPFFDLDLYFQTNAVLRGGETKPVGCYFYLPQLGSNATYIETVFREVKTLDVGKDVILTYRITDTAGHRWLAERRKPTKLVTWRNSKQIDRKLERLDSSIGKECGDHYIEAHPRQES
jgi:hypothetical protein